MILRLRLLLLLLLDVLRRVSADLETIHDRLEETWICRNSDLQQGFRTPTGALEEMFVTASDTQVPDTLNSAYVLRTVSDDTWREIPSAQFQVDRRSGRRPCRTTTSSSSEASTMKRRIVQRCVEIVQKRCLGWSVLPSFRILMQLGASIGSIVYIFGGADYDAQTGFYLHGP